MTKLFVLALAAVSSAAAAQTPAANPMPDGSRDMYIGLGVASAPRYEGGAERDVSALPVLQFQWSSGLFVSGLSAGIHMSRLPQVEFGPLLEVQPRRDASGSGGEAGGIGETRLSDAPFAKGFADNPLTSVPRLHRRLQAGGFLNMYLSPDWRLTASALYGAGNERHGARLELGVQRLALNLGAHHRLTLGAAVSLVNRSHNAAFFGISEEDSINSGSAPYAPGGGLKDARLGARWNWSLSPSWILSSKMQATRLLGDARRSPLVERPTNLTVSTAIAYRF